jgi:hypothetical protein
MSRELALLGAAVLASLWAAMVFHRDRILSVAASHPTMTKRVTVAMVASAWLVWMGVIAFAQQVDGWDESAYFLSGLALRGYQVPYALHRAPITGMLCALFAEWPRWINPTLLLILVTSLYWWARELLSPTTAFLALFIVSCQDVLLQCLVDISSELPAAVLLVLGFRALSRQRWQWAALSLTLAVFTRWNLAPVWLVIAVAMLVRFGRRPFLAFLAMGCGAFAIWYTGTLAWTGSEPLRAVYEGNVLPALAWAETQQQRPDLMARSLFYGSHFFFLTPSVLAAVLVSPCERAGKDLTARDWVTLVAVPLALTTYLASMLFVGGLESRFMAPIVPSAVVCSLAWLQALCGDRTLLARDRVAVFATAAFASCAFGLWPLSVLPYARANMTSPAVFSETLATQLQQVDRHITFCGAAATPLTEAGGLRAMAEARHSFEFPRARRDGNGNILETPESLESVLAAVAACPAGSLMVVPRRFATAFGGSLVLEDGRWAILRRG